MAKDRVVKDIGPREQIDWHDIDWRAARKRVKNLRRRIFRATQNKRWNQVRSLMKLMLRSISNLLLSVRKVTQENKGKRTPGLDGHVVLTPKARVQLVHEMKKYQAWKVKPAKRIYIPKADGKQRPLGILTVKNRAAQAIVKNAREPYCEAQFESHSYGFRPGRSAHDAIEQCWRRLNRHCKDQWILDADIRSAFDSISQKFINSQLEFFPARELVKSWLKAGYVEAEILHDTADGVQQGGVVSPVLANLALDGMQLLVGRNLGFVRYADDFIITARTKEELLCLKPTLEAWLAERGMVLHPDKTKIVHIRDGFDFLGFNIRQYRGVCLVKPQKKKVLGLLQRIRQWLRCHWTVTPGEVVQYLNPLLTGWTAYYRRAVSKQVFDYIKHQLWISIWKWCLRRHPNKSYRWTKAKYFTRHKGQEWRFYAEILTDSGEQIRDYLVSPSDIQIQRHIKVRADACADDPSLQEYWEKRANRTHRLAHSGRMTASHVHDLLEA